MLPLLKREVEPRPNHLDPWGHPYLMWCTADGVEVGSLGESALIGSK